MKREPVGSPHIDLIVDRIVVFVGDHVHILNPERITTSQAGRRIIGLVQTFENDRHTAGPKIENFIEPGTPLRCQKLLKKVQILGVVHVMGNFSGIFSLFRSFSENSPGNQADH
jgi:hypothetical protein